MQRVVAILVLLMMAACGKQPLGEAKISVLVSVVPQKYFVEQIAGNTADVTVLIPPGANPAAYEMSPSGMRVVSGADVWFTIGLQREVTWTTEFASINEQLRMVSTIDGITRLPITRYGLTEHGAGTGPGDIDPHVWLSPEMVRKQAAVICETLSVLNPEEKDLYNANLDAFLQRIDGLQSEIHRLLEPYAGRGFMVFHPAWGYFADEFNLVQVPIEIAGSEPSPGEMARLIEYGLNSGIKIVFVSPQFSEESAEVIAGEMNARVVFIDPLASDWAENLLYVATEVAAAMEQ